MNNKGYALTGILYTSLIVFATIMIALLFNLQNRKTILNELKEDVADAANSEANYNYLYSEIQELKKNVGSSHYYVIEVGSLSQEKTKVADYPNGFTMDNSVVLSYMIDSTSYKGWITSTVSGSTVVLGEDGIYAIGTSNDVGKKAKIVLYQYS